MKYNISGLVNELFEQEETYGTLLKCSSKEWRRPHKLQQKPTALGLKYESYTTSVGVITVELYQEKKDEKVEKQKYVKEILVYQYT